jgi:2-C-methyl-D-erythritol 2,4-cyclodiphosphate synthase
MIRVGLGFDVHPFGGEGPLVLGGVTVEGPSLEGHSDADVVAHAVADSLLGPVGLPDLGTLFPAADEQYRGISSMDLLREVAQRVHAERWWVGNVDVVIAAEQPRLAPHLAGMQAGIAAALEPVRRPMGPGVHISITPKRGEGIGFVGRAEGIAAWAVALLELA